LQQKLQERKGSIPISEAIAISVQVARALQHAGERGLIHKDIKPENILISSTGVVKLCDLGLAQRVDQKRPKRKKDFGTPAYMSPEQIRCELEIDIRSDIYSLGVTLYRMVFGCLPFTGTSQEIMAKHLGEKLRFSSENMNKQKMEIAKIIHKMMAKDRNERFQTPAELIQSLEDMERHVEQMDRAGTLEFPVGKSGLKTYRHTQAFKMKAKREKRK
jgi:serine/threonine-protein kinase